MGAPHGRSSRCRVCKRAGTRQHLCGFCCGIWARHPHSLGFSAASGQEYFRDHRRLIPCSCPRRGSLSYGPPFTLTAS